MYTFELHSSRSANGDGASCEFFPHSFLQVPHSFATHSRSPYNALTPITHVGIYATFAERAKRTTPLLAAQKNGRADTRDWLALHTLSLTHVHIRACIRTHSFTLGRRGATNVARVFAYVYLQLALFVRFFFYFAARARLLCAPTPAPKSLRAKGREGELCLCESKEVESCLICEDLLCVCVCTWACKFFN